MPTSVPPFDAGATVMTSSRKRLERLPMKRIDVHTWSDGGKTPWIPAC